jgi:hypothetical protein
VDHGRQRLAGFERTRDLSVRGGGRDGARGGNLGAGRDCHEACVICGRGQRLPWMAADCRARRWRRESAHTTGERDNIEGRAGRVWRRENAQIVGLAADSRERGRERGEWAMAEPCTKNCERLH